MSVSSGQGAIRTSQATITSAPVASMPGREASQHEAGSPVSPCRQSSRPGPVMSSQSALGLPRQVSIATKTATAVIAQALEVVELHMAFDRFNPASPLVRQQLLGKLGLPTNAAINEMQGFKGGLNEGIWFISMSGAMDLVLKLVRCNRIANNVLTEAENFTKIARQHSSMYTDPVVAFPLKIFSCLDRAGNKRNDLIVMPKVRGERLAEWIARKFYNKQVPLMMQVFERVGGKLAEFHSRYGNAQHGDFQPSNIFYDEERGDIRFIDIGGMDVPTTETDVQHFVRSLELLAETYGKQLVHQGRRSFEQGYRSKSS